MDSSEKNADRSVLRSYLKSLVVFAEKAGVGIDFKIRHINFLEEIGKEEALSMIEEIQIKLQQEGHLDFWSFQEYLKYVY